MTVVPVFLAFTLNPQSSNRTTQFKSRDKDWIERRFLCSPGTYRTLGIEIWPREVDREMVPCRSMGSCDPFPTITVSLPLYGCDVENEFIEGVIWLEAPLSKHHELSEMAEGALLCTECTLKSSSDRRA